MVVFPFYPTTITPLSCILLNSPITSTACNNLYTATNTSPNPLTINTTAVSSINPNIITTLTIVIGFNTPLTANTTYSLQIIMQDNLPSVGAISQSFEMYAISGTGVMI
jgi:hypothetical protein